MRKLPTRDPLGDSISKVVLTDCMSQDAALKVVNSARISFANESTEFTEKDKTLAQYLWDNEHHSPFRHTYYTFTIKMPLFVARQWVKYQVGSNWRVYEINGEEVGLEMFDIMFDEEKGCSWNEQSGRYAKFQPEFFIPKNFRGPKEENKQSSVPLGEEFDHEGWERLFTSHCKTSFRRYEAAIEDGMCKEQARMLIPQNIYTTMTWTASLQSVMWFLHQRRKEDAQEEIRKYAEAVYSLISKDLEKLGIQDG